MRPHHEDAYVQSGKDEVQFPVVLFGVILVDAGVSFGGSVGGNSPGAEEGGFTEEVVVGSGLGEGPPHAARWRGGGFVLEEGRVHGVGPWKVGDMMVNRCGPKTAYIELLQDNAMNPLM